MTFVPVTASPSDLTATKDEAEEDVDDEDPDKSCRNVVLSVKVGGNEAQVIFTSCE